MNLAYKGKPVIPTKRVLDELSKIEMDLSEVPDILKQGFRLRKRKNNIIERAVVKGNKIINIVAVDLGDYYKIIHAGKFTINKKFRRLMENKNEF